MVRGAKAGDVHELDGDKCSVGAVREFDTLAQTYARGFIPSPPTVLIVNEAHAMSRQAVQAWLTLLERLPAGWFVVFTTTEKSADLFGDFNGPFMSRCTSIRLTSQGLCATFARLSSRIATREGLNGRPIASYENLAKEHHNNMRGMLQDIDDGRMLPD